METVDYYRRLAVMELEGDLFKAITANNLKRTRSYMARLADAKTALAEAEAEQQK